MRLSTVDVVGILADNLERRGSVLPIPARAATGWARGLALPRGGPRVLYTGAMYQLIPYIERVVRLEQRIADTPLARLSGLARRVNRVVNAIGLVARPSAAERRDYDAVPANVARLLQRAGVEFGSLYEDDLYAGALAYDLGADEVVAAHARRVARIFERYGVREVITIDPHTTTMLRSIYPRLVPGYDVSVRTYLEVLAAAATGSPRAVENEVVIHDSCVFARAEGVLEAPRELLAAAGLRVLEPVHSRARTWCCGGPVESLDADKAAQVAAARVAQLREVGTACVTMCPLCLINLRKAAGDTLSVRDISEYLIGAAQPDASPERPPQPARSATVRLASSEMREGS
ncbi:MAG: (Fe-S)-binding protein [Actinomycetota bacterium]|nr:(Fe-S)-binding protein [Actinomycetota bacterium]